MSEIITPSLSIPELAAALRGAITSDQQLTLNPDTFSEQVPTGYLLGFLDADTLTLAAAQVSEAEQSLTLSGTASFLTLTDLQVTLTVTALDGGLGLSLRASPAGRQAMQFPGLSWLSVDQVAVAVDVTLTASTPAITGALTGTIRLDTIDVPISIRLPPTRQGWIITGSVAAASRPSSSALAGLVDGLDLLPSLPLGLGDLLTVRTFEILVKKVPYLAFTLASTQPWEIVPDALSIERIEVFVNVVMATADNPRDVQTRLEAMLRVGNILMPIALTKDEGGSAWNLGLDSLEVPLPGLADLAQLFGGTEQLESMMPGLGNFGALALTSLQMSFDPAQRTVSALSFRATAQNDWSLPLLSELALRQTTVALTITAPFKSTRTVSGSVSAVVVVSGLEFRISARKAPGAAWLLEGKQLIEEPLSLTTLARDFLGGALPDGVPEFSFADVEVSLAPSSGEFSLSGRSAAPWQVPLGPTVLTLSNVQIALSRSLIGGQKATSLQLSGDLSISGVTASLALKLPGGLSFSTALPAIKLSEVLGALGGGGVLEGLGLPTSFFDLSLGPSTITVDAAARSASLSGSAAGFGALELQLKPDSQGKMGAALALKPAAGVNLQTLLGVPGLGGFELADLVFVLSSIHDPTLHFSNAAFATVGPVTRGFGFSAKIDLAGLGVGVIPGLPTAPIAMQARFGRTLSEFTLAAAMSQPGGRFLIDPASGLYLIDPELRISPATAELGIAGRIEVILDGQKLNFIGGFKLGGSAAELFATMQGDWKNPCGISGLVARDLSLALRLPGFPALSGTLQFGRQSASLTIKPDPAAPVFELDLPNLDLHDLLATVCDPALANVPAEFQQILTDVRIENAHIYMAPRATTIGTKQYDAGVTVLGKLHVFGLDIDGIVKTAGSSTPPSLRAEGTVSLPNLGGVLVLAERFDGSGAPQGKPHFLLKIEPGQAPVVSINAAVQVLGLQVASVEIKLNDAGFKLMIIGALFGGDIRAKLEISGGRLGAQGKYAVAAELEASSILALLQQVKQGLTQATAGAAAEIARAQALLTDTNSKAATLTQAMESQRQQIQAERDRNAAKLRQAESELQKQSAQVQALYRSLESARQTVLEERAKVYEALAAAQRDVDAADGAVASLNNEINATSRWYYGLPKIGVPWEASQSREAVWFAAKMSGLYIGLESVKAGLKIAYRALQAISDTKATFSFSVDIDPRVAGILAAYNLGIPALQVAQTAVATLRNSTQLLPIDADFRVVALASLQQAQTIQLIAARSALDLAQRSLSGIATLGASLIPNVDIRRAYFSSELSTLQDGKVHLELEISTASGPSAFAIDFNFNDVPAAAVALVNRLLSTDTGKAIAAAAKSTSTAATTIRQVEEEVLPTGRIVTLRSGQNGQLLRVLGSNLLRFGDTISLYSDSGYYLVAESNGAVNANRSAIGASERWVIVKPSDPGCGDFVRYGDVVSLRSCRNTYLTAGGAENINANQGTTVESARWVILHAIDVSRRGEVDTSQNVGLRSPANTLLGAWNGGGGGTFAWNPTIGVWEKWKLIAPDNSAFDHCLVARSDNDILDPACHFQLQRNGDWMGFQSRNSNLFVNVGSELAVRASSSNFGDAAHTSDKFRLEIAALFCQANQRYLRYGEGPGNVPRLLDCGGTVRSDASNTFVIQEFSEVSHLMVDPSSLPPRAPTADEVATSVQQQDALAGSATAADGPNAQRSAAAQAMQAEQAGINLVEPARLALVQAEADRRARRERAIQKATRGTPLASVGCRDSALRFDGQSYLEAPTSRAALREAPGIARVNVSPILALGASFTVESWVYPEALPGDHASILNKWRDEIDDELMFSINNEGRLSLAWHVDGASARGVPGWSSCQSSESLKLEAWSHVAAVRDGDTVSLYIDGRRVGGASGMGSGPLRAGTAPWSIGAQAGGSRFFVGLIDSIRIWDLAQSAATLRTQRYSIASGDEHGLLTCWNFDEDSGDTAYDCGPCELHARLGSGMRRASPGGPEAPLLPDRHLTLTNRAHAVIGDVDLFASSAAITIEAWVYIDRIGEDVASILSKWAQGPDDEFLFGLGASGKLVFFWHTQGGSAYGTPGWNHQYSDETVPMGRWCHVAVVREGTVIRFYCDGEPIGASDSCDALPLRRGPVPLSIGSQCGQLRFFEGSLAELRVWRHAVPGEKIREHYRRPLTGDESGLGALWQLDEGWGSVVRDAVLLGHPGTLVGPVTWLERGGPPRIAAPTHGLHLLGNQYIEFGDDDLFTASVAITLESWVRVDAITEDFTSIISKGGQSTDSEYLFGMMPDGRLAFVWHTQGEGAYGSPSFGHVFSEQKITQGRFTHVALVRAAKTVAFFIDGRLAGSFDVADDQPFRNSAAPLRIGAEGAETGRFFQGTMANLRIWRVARTPEQLAAGMQGLVSGREPGRVLELRFDEGEGTKVLDTASGEIGYSVGASQFVSVTLPLRKVAPATAPIELWRQPAEEAAIFCHDTGIALPDALAIVEAALAQAERPTHPQSVSLLARAGYLPQAIGAFCVQSWGYDATQVAQLYFTAERPASEALPAIEAALSLVGQASQEVATTLASAAGYTPESLGAALLDVWGHDARAVAKLYRNAWTGLSATNAVRAVWTTLGRSSLPCLASCVDVLLSAGYPLSAIAAALQEHFGYDESSVARAVQRAQAALQVVHPPIAAPPVPWLALRAFNGHYVHLAGSGSNAADVVAICTSPKQAQPLLLCDLSNNRVALRTYAGKYVSVRPGDLKLVATADAIGIGESFVRSEKGGGVIALQASNGAFVCAGGGEQALLANRSGAGLSETFTVVELCESTAPPVEPNPSPPSELLGSLNGCLLDLALVGAVTLSQPGVSGSASGAASSPTPPRIVPGNFSGTSSRTQVLVYDASLGTWCIYRWDASLGFVALGASQGGWRTGGQIIPLKVSGSAQTHVLFYDPTLGQGQVFRWNAAMNRMESVGPLMTGWSTTLKIIPGNFVNSAASQLLFYDFANGTATVNGFDQATGLGGLGPVRSGWRTTWQIVPLALPGYVDTCFLLYDPTVGEALVYRWDITGGEVSMGPLMTGWRRTWNIIPAHDAQDGATLFHDTATGPLFCFKFSYSGGTLSMQNGWTMEGENTTCGPATVGGSQLVIHPVQIIPGDFGGTRREFYICLPATLPIFDFHDPSSQFQIKSVSAFPQQLIVSNSGAPDGPVIVYGDESWTSSNNQGKWILAPYTGPAIVSTTAPPGPYVDCGFYTIRNLQNGQSLIVANNGALNGSVRLIGDSTGNWGQESTNTQAVWRLWQMSALGKFIIQHANGQLLIVGCSGALNGPVEVFGLNGTWGEEQDNPQKLWVFIRS